MTKDEALQKANDYCSEKGYGETLTPEFRDKFSDFFAKKYPDQSADDDSVTADLKFNLNTAFSATSKAMETRQKTFATKEAEMKKRIEELEKQIGDTKKTDDTKKDDTKPVIPKEVQDQLDELKKYRDAETKEKKAKEVIDIAKKNVRNDLHKSFETFADGFVADVNESSEEQAKKLVNRFQAIFKDTIGDIKPLAPQQTRKRDDEVISSLKRIKV